MEGILYFQAAYAGTSKRRCWFHLDSESVLYLALLAKIETPGGLWQGYKRREKASGKQTLVSDKGRTL
jgi:hypothetical protein